MACTMTRRDNQRGTLATTAPHAVKRLDLSTAKGLSAVMAATLNGLAALPFDLRVANAVASVANAARRAIEVGSIEKRLAALEPAQAPGLRRHRPNR